MMGKTLDTYDFQIGDSVLINRFGTRGTVCGFLDDYLLLKMENNEICCYLPKDVITLDIRMRTYKKMNK